MSDLIKLPVSFLCTVLIVLIFACPLLAEPAQSDENPVSVLGDYLEYKTELEIVIAKGNAHVYREDMDLTADNIHVDMKQNLIFAEGNVVFWQNDKKTCGDFLIYNLSSGDGTIENARYFHGTGIIYASTLEFGPRFMKGENILWTTCLDEENPHYSTRAQKIIIYTDDRMILHNMSFYAGKTRLYNKSHDVIDLKKRDRKIKTKYSYSKLNGISIKTTYDYFLDSFNFGTAFYDFYQKQGDTFGTDHRMKNGNIYYSNISDLPDRQENNLNITYNGNFLKRFSFNLNSNIYARQYQGSATDKEIDYNIQFGSTSRNGFFQRIDTTFYGRADLDGDSYTLDNTYNIVQKLPEVKIDCQQIQPRNLGITVTTNIVAGRYVENSSDGEESRYSLDVRNRYNFQRFDISKDTKLQLSAESRGTVYTEDHRYSALGRASLTQQHTENLRQEITYTRKIVKGESPFQYDQEYERNTLSSLFTYNFNPYIIFRLAHFDYDFESNNFTGLYNECEIKSTQNRKNSWSLYSKFSYTSQNEQFRRILKIPTSLDSIYLRYSIRPKTKDWSLNLSSSYISDTRKFEYVDIQSTFMLGHKLATTASGRFDTEKSRMTSQRYNFTYDMHCFESTLAYDVTREEILFEFYLKAFPQKKRTVFYDIKNNQLKPQIKNLDY